MTKPELLDHLARVGNTNAYEAADAFGLAYSAAAMALLRLTRQGLVVRSLDPESAMYWYTLTEEGEKRLAFFRSLEDAAT